METGVININGQEDSDEVNTVDFTNEKLTVPEFVQWCSDTDHGLSKVKEISEVKYQLSFLPKEAMALLELKKQSYTQKEFEEACSHYTDLTYFSLKLEIPDAHGEILKYNLSTASQYETRIRYLAFEMENDICIIQNGDSIKPALYHYERIYEVAPFAKTMVAFDNKKFDLSKEFTVVLNDRLFEKGYIKFNYKDGQLLNLPKTTAI